MESNSKIKLGDYFEYEFSFMQEDVDNFAKASGDFNPIHLDREFAKKSIFKKRILHGFLGGSVFSKVFGTIFPGEGTIYLKQNMSFFKPMFTSENYVATFKILEVQKDKNRALVQTQVLDENKNIIINGEALIQHHAIE